jgi:hypothetical protein
LLPEDPTPRQLAVLDAAAPLLQTRIRLLTEAVPLLRSEFVAVAGVVTEADVGAARG